MCEREFRKQGQTVTLNCQAGISINVTYVNYGRTRPYGEVCNYDNGNDITTCGPQDVVTQRVRDACQGRQSCQLTYTGLSLWDTCLNTYKYFEVKYTCTVQGESPCPIYFAKHFNLNFGSQDRLIFIMEIPIPGKAVVILRLGPDVEWR